MRKEDKVILVLGGGGMTGVFGAGILVELKRLNFYSSIEVICGTSAGAINAAYFLSRQAKLGSSIYYQDLINDFILPLNIPYGSFQRFWNRYVHSIPEKKMLNAINIDYLFKIMTRRKILNLSKLTSQKIPLYVKRLDRKTGKIEYLDIRQSKNPLQLLKESVAMIPYYFYSGRYLDGALRKSIDLPFLLRRYPSQKIVIALNYPKKRKKIFYLFRFIEGLIASLMLDQGFRPIRWFLEKERGIEKDIKSAQKIKRVLMIFPPKDKQIYPFTTNQKRLKAFYESGQKEAAKIVDFVDT